MPDCEERNVTQVLHLGGRSRSLSIIPLATIPSWSPTPSVLQHQSHLKLLLSPIATQCLVLVSLSAILAQVSLNLTSLFQCRLCWLFSLYFFTVVSGSLLRYPGGLYRPFHRINSPSLIFPPNHTVHWQCSLACVQAYDTSACRERSALHLPLQGLTCPQCLPGLGNVRSM